MTVVNIVGVTLLIIFGIFILSKNPKVKPDYLLLIVVVMLASYLLAVNWVNSYLNVWSFLTLTFTAAFLFFPFLVYALLLIEKTHRFRWFWWWFILFDAVYMTYIIVDIFAFDRLEDYSIQELFDSPPLVYYIFYKAHGIYKIAVLVWYLRKLNRYQVQIKDYYSNLKTISLNWLKYFVWVYIGENAISSIVFLIHDLGYLTSLETSYFITNTIFVLALFYLIFNGIKQYTLASFSDLKKVEQSDKPDNEKYKTSSLSDEEMEQLFNNIERLFNEEQVYHDPELKIQHLAERLHVTSHNISQTINLKAKKPFYDYVNSYRVAFFADLLKDPEKRKFTILALGIESGFNSKASLNRIFKQQLGITPREYQQQALAS